MRVKNLFLCSLIAISLFATCACSSSTTTQPSETSPSAATTDSPTPAPLQIPDEQELIQGYTDELSKLTSSNIENITYENFSEDEFSISVNVLAKMADGRTLDIYASKVIYPDKTDNSKWSVGIIKNQENSHYYYISGDEGKAISDMYDYDSDTLIPKSEFIKSYKIKKLNFNMPISGWEKSETNDQIRFYKGDSLSRSQITVFTSKIPLNSLDRLWNALSKNFDNYSCKEKKDIKIDGVNAKQWEFTFTKDSQDYTATMTLAIKGKTLYSFYLLETFKSYNFLYDELLIKTASWTKKK